MIVKDIEKKFVFFKKNYRKTIKTCKKLLTNDNFYNIIEAIKNKEGSKMETKTKIIQTSKVCYKATKVLYYVSYAACLIFLLLAVVLSCTNAIKGYSQAETACLFGTLAAYSFICSGLLWNIAGVFKSIREKAPFCNGVSAYLKKSAVFVLLLSVVPAIVGSTVLRIAEPSTQWVFPISFGGIISGFVTFMLGMFFEYGAELQAKDDETL